MSLLMWNKQKQIKNTLDYDCWTGVIGREEGEVTSGGDVVMDCGGRLLLFCCEYDVEMTYI